MEATRQQDIQSQKQFKVIGCVFYLIGCLSPSMVIGQV